MAMEFDDCKGSVLWREQYQEAVRTLAWWKFEAVNSEICEPRRFAKYNDRYVGGFEILKIVTGKTYGDINRDIVDAYNERYNK